MHQLRTAAQKPPSQRHAKYLALPAFDKRLLSINFSRDICRDRESQLSFLALRRPAQRFASELPVPIVCPNGPSRTVHSTSRRVKQALLITIHGHEQSRKLGLTKSLPTSETECHSSSSTPSPLGQLYRVQYSKIRHRSLGKAAISPPRILGMR